MKKSLINPTEQPTIAVHVTGDRIGDALIKWPVIVALKRALADHRLIWFAGLRKSVFNGSLAGLAAGVIDEVHDCAGIGVSWWELMRPPPSRHFDIVVATEPKIRNAILLKRQRHNTFISPAANFRLSDRRPKAGVRYPDSVYDQMRTLATLAAGCELTIEPIVEVGDENQRRAKELLPDGNNNYLGLAPGSAGATKRWPLSRYIELAKHQARSGYTPVFFLGPQELAMHGDIAAALPMAIFPEQSEIARTGGGPLLSIALAQRISVGVANDAGGGHLLAAGCRPVITLFGHTSEHKFKPPYGKRMAINATDYGGTDMALIPVTRVVAELAAIVQVNDQ